MTTALHQWINESVHVTLASSAPAVEGSLLAIDDAGIMLEKPTGKMFIPLAAILLIKLCEPAEASDAAFPSAIGSRTRQSAGGLL